MNKITGAIGAFLLAACAPLMQGSFVITYQVNAGAPVTCSIGPDVATSCLAAPTNVGGGVTLDNVSGFSNSPGSAGGAEQFGSFTNVTTTSAATLHIWFAAQDFSAPTTPPSIDYSSNLGLTSTQGIGSVGLESCIDSSNGTAPPVGTFCSSPAATLTNVAQNYSGSISKQNTVSTTLASLTATPYSLSQEVTLTLGANSSLNIATSQILTPVPEPASLLLLGSALLGVSLLVRRKMESKRV